MTDVIAFVESVLLVLGTVVLVLRRLFGKGRKRKERSWQAFTVPSKQRVGSMAVGVEYGCGGDFVTLRYVPFDAADFDEQMAKWIAIAEDRAASLGVYA